MSLPTPLAAPALPTSPVWVGSSELQESPDSPQISLSKDGLVYTKIFTGPFSVVEAALPTRFSTMTGVPPSLLVDTASVKHSSGDIGTLTITCCVSPSQGISDSPVPIEEIEWVEYQRPLKSHKMFQSGGVNELDDGDLADIIIWQNQSEATRIKAFQFPSTAAGASPGGGYDTLSENAQVYAKKWLRGQEFYNEYGPVYRNTLTLPTSPTTGGCGIIGDPETTDKTVPPYYKWLKNADRCIKRSRAYERVQEWIGAWWWDSDIYSTAKTGGTDG